MAAAKPDTIKAKISTSRMSADIGGTLDYNIGVIFTFVSTPERRQAVIDDLIATNARMNADAQADNLAAIAG